MLRLGDGSRRYLYAHDREQLVSKVHAERWRVARGIPVKVKGLALRNYAEQWLARTTPSDVGRWSIQYARPP
jgi:hypothetical protein